MSFSNLKKQSSLGSLTAKLVSQVEKMNKGSNGVDDRLWKPEVDKAGNGYAVIRFLPAPDGEDLPWAKLYTHAFQASGGWYIENSLTTLGQKDPVSEHNSQLWNSGVDSDKEIARKQKRKLSYYSNVYVVKDPSNPANEGKVFLFRYGKKIFDKITAAMQPEFEDEQAINPFDFWAGANFKLKIRKVDGYWNYDKSEFEAPSKINEDDDYIEALWKKQYALKEFSAPTNFKSYDALKIKFEKVVYGSGKTATADEIDIPPVSAEAVVSDTPEVSEPTLPTQTSPSDEGEDDTMNYFSKLVNQ